MPGSPEQRLVREHVSEKEVNVWIKSEDNHPLMSFTWLKSDKREQPNAVHIDYCDALTAMETFRHETSRDVKAVFAHALHAILAWDSSTQVMTEDTPEMYPDLVASALVAVQFHSVMSALGRACGETPVYQTADVDTDKAYTYKKLEA